MSIDFSSALRQEAEQKFKSDLFAAIEKLSKQVDDLQAKVDALAAKSKAKAPDKE